MLHYTLRVPFVCVKLHIMKNCFSLIWNRRCLRLVFVIKSLSTSNLILIEKVSPFLSLYIGPNSSRASKRRMIGARLSRRRPPPLRREQRREPSRTGSPRRDFRVANVTEERQEEINQMSLESRNGDAFSSIYNEKQAKVRIISKACNCSKSMYYNILQRIEVEWWRKRIMNCGFGGSSFIITRHENILLHHVRSTEKHEYR